MNNASLAVLALVALLGGCHESRAPQTADDPPDDYDQQAWASTQGDTTGAGSSDGYYGSGHSSSPQRTPADPSRVHHEPR